MAAVPDWLCSRDLSMSSDEGAEKLEQAISELRGRGEQMELTDTEEKPTGE